MACLSPANEGKLFASFSTSSGLRRARLLRATQNTDPHVRSHLQCLIRERPEHPRRRRTHWLRRHHAIVAKLVQLARWRSVRHFQAIYPLEHRVNGVVGTCCCGPGVDPPYACRLCSSSTASLNFRFSSTSFCHSTCLDSSSSTGPDPLSVLPSALLASGWPSPGIWPVPRFY